MDIAFHYPPELTQLLIDVIPLLSRSKADVLLFFRGAGVPSSMLADLDAKLRADRKSLNKYEIVRTVLQRLNEAGERTLRERREVLKRVIEFEDFSTCWPDDQLKAKGLVAEIRRVVNVKDSFTRMRQEREREQQERARAREEEQRARQAKREALAAVRTELNALFGIADPHARGKALERVLTSLFEAVGIAVREPFTVRGSRGEGVVEQVDGVVELDGHLHFIEMKWWKEPVGVPEVSQQLVRVYHRAEARALLISASGYTDPALAIAREALQQKVVALVELEEIVFLLEREHDLVEFLRAKVHAAIIDKNPLHRPLGR